MKVSEPTQEGVVRKFDVELTAEELKPHFDKAFKKAQKSMKLDGFRPGKVPISVLEKRFGDAIRQEAMEDILEAVYPEALAETDLRPLAPGRVEDVDYDPEDHLKFTAVVEVEPEVKADGWKGVDVVKEVVKVTDEDVDRHIDHMRRDQAIIEERGEDEGAEKGDRITADLQEVDEAGVPVIGNKQEDATFEIGDDAIGHGGDEQLIGAKVGETRRVNTHQHQQGEGGQEQTKDLHLDVTIKKIEKIDLPELDDDFVVSVNEKLNTVADFRADVRSQLEQYGEYQSKQRLAQRLLDAVVNAHPFEVPPTLLKQTLDEMVKSRSEQYGGAVDQKALEEQLRPIAEGQLRWFFLRKQIIADLGLEASEEEINDQLQKYADSHEGADLESLKLMFKSGEKRDQLVDEIVQGKLMEALMENANIEEKETDFLSILR